jgi:hypothetical protein
MVTRYDVIAVKAEVSKEGWIRDRPVITRSGIFEYRTADGKIRKEYRPDSEVFSDTSLATANGIPVTDSHRGLVDSKNVDGIIGTVTSNGIKDEANVLADVIIHNPSRLGDKRELSLGYECDIDETPGEYNGQRYDCVQKNIIYNHLAAVKKGRAGNARLRLDSNDAIIGTFQMETPMEPTTKLVTIRLDGIDYQASPEISNALNKEREALAALQKRFDTVEAERDTLKSTTANFDKELKAAREAGRAVVKVRLDLEDVARQHKVKFDDDDTDQVIKTNVLGKLRPELKLDGKSEDYIDSAFDLTMEANKDKQKKVVNQLSRFDKAAPSGDNNVTEMGGAGAARARYLARLRGEKTEDGGGKAA